MKEKHPILRAGGLTVLVVAAWTLAGCLGSGETDAKPPSGSPPETKTASPEQQKERSEGVGRRNDSGVNN